MPISLAFIAGLIVALASVPIAIKICKSLDLMDKPSSRKKHLGNIPLAGGMVLLCALGVYFLIVQSVGPVTLAILITAPMLFLLGALDDHSDIAAKRRLLVQSSIGVLLALGLGVRVIGLDSIVSGSYLELSFGISVIFSVACFCGVLNAANMADGIDGLLGCFAVISMAAMAWLGVSTGQASSVGVTMLLIGALSGCLMFNLGFFGRRNKIFFGDSGSLVVGLCLFVLLVTGAAPGNGAFTPTSAGWILGVPLVDTVSVMIRRISQRRSPFEAGRDHLHHLLLDSKFGRIQSLAILLILHLCLVLVGISANYTDVSQAVYFWTFVLITALATMLSAVAQRSAKIVNKTVANFFE